MNDNKTIDDSIGEEIKDNYEIFNLNSLVNNDNKRKINTVTSSKTSQHYISNLINESCQLNVRPETKNSKKNISKFISQNSNPLVDASHMKEIIDNKNFQDLLAICKLDINCEDLCDNSDLMLGHEDDNNFPSRHKKKLSSKIINSKKSKIPLTNNISNRDSSKDTIEAAASSNHMNYSKFNGMNKDKEDLSIFDFEDFSDKRKIKRNNTKKVTFGEQKKFKSKRVTQKYKNVHDSFDSSMEEKEYNYEDYVPKIINISRDTEGYLTWKKIRQNIIFFAVVYYSFLFSIQSIHDDHGIQFVIISLFFEIFLIINFCLRCFLIPFHDTYINKLKYNLISIFIHRIRKGPVRMIVDVISVLPIVTISVMSQYLFAENEEMLINKESFSTRFLSSFYKISYISKCILIYYLRKWIHFSSIFEFKNKKFEKKKIKAKNEENDDSSGVDLVVMKIFLFFVLISHVSACIWIGLAKIDTENYSWISRNGLNDSSYFDVYIAALYFTITTLITVGYGDFFPKTITERVFVIVFLIFGCLIYSFILTIVSALMKNQNLKKQVYEEKQATLKELSGKYSIPKDLFRELECTLHHNYKNWKKDKEELINVLPSSLKISIQLKIYEEFIQKIKFFEKISNINFILHLASKLKSFANERNKFLIQVGENIEEMYFITKGKIQISFVYNKMEVKLANINGGMSYGDIMMYTYSRSPFNITTLSACYYFTLKKSDFTELKFQYEDFINTFLKESYKVHFHVETKKSYALEYIKKNNNLLGFEDYFRKVIDLEIYKSLFISKSTIAEKRRKKVIFNEDLHKIDEVEEKNELKDSVNDITNHKMNLLSDIAQLKKESRKLSELSKQIKNNESSKVIRIRSRQSSNFNKSKTIKPWNRSNKCLLLSKEFIELKEEFNNLSFKKDYSLNIMISKQLSNKSFAEAKEENTIKITSKKYLRQNKTTSFNLNEIKNNIGKPTKFNNLTIQKTSKLEIISYKKLVNNITLKKIISNVNFNTGRIKNSNSSKRLIAIKSKNSQNLTLRDVSTENEMEIIKTKKDHFLHNVHNIIENKALTSNNNNYLNDVMFNFVSTMAIKKKHSKRKLKKATAKSSNTNSFNEKLNENG